MKLVWTEPAVDALRAIQDYIAKDNLFYAAQFVERLTRSAEQLIDFPEIGRQVPEAGLEEIREILFQRYRIIYRLRPGLVQILTVLHSARDLSHQGPKPWEVG
jgi:plasmid stabilization system protein ParE